MTTRLEILNAMLAVNGESPVSTADSNDPAAIQAGNKLKVIDKKIQSRGWYFNKEDILLSPDLAGKVVLPQNTLAADPVDPGSPYIKRGTGLYDRKNNTTNIGRDVLCTVVLQLKIDELPEVAAAYIMDKAVKEYYTDDDGDAQKANDLKEREGESYAYLHREQLANEDVNIRRSQLGSKLLRNTRSSNYIDPGA
jgi:hypothetical protein